MKRITLSFPWPLTAAETQTLIGFGFQISLLTYISCLLVELLRPGFISLFVSLNVPLVPTIVFGVASGLWPLVIEPIEHPDRLSIPMYLWFLAVALLSGGVVWYATRSLGNLAPMIAFFTTVVVFGLNIIVSQDRDEHHPS